MAGIRLLGWVYIAIASVGVCIYSDITLGAHECNVASQIDPLIKDNHTESFLYGEVFSIQ